MKCDLWIESATGEPQASRRRVSSGSPQQRRQSRHSGSGPRLRTNCIKPYPRRLILSAGRAGTLDTPKPQPQNKKITQIVSTETTPTDIRETTKRSSMIGGASPCNSANWPSSFLRRGGTGEASRAKLCRSRSPISSQIAWQCFGSKGAWVRSGSSMGCHRRARFPAAAS